MKVEQVCKSLGAGVAVYAIVAACGSPHGGSLQSTSSGEALLAPVKGAMAQAGSPVTIAQPVKIVTADSDPAQHVGGSAYPTVNAIAVVAGPVFITDLRVSGAELGTAFAYAFTGKFGDCGAKTSDLNLSLPATSNRMRGDLNSIHGARFFVPEGLSLCLSSPSTVGAVSWAGFRPYS